MGTFLLGVDSTYLVRYDRTYPDGSVVKGAGTYDLGMVLARWRWTATAGWQRGPFDVTADARYIGSIKECGDEYGALTCSAHPEYSRRVRSNLVFDLAGGWEGKSGLGTTRVTAGVRNVFDSAPPKIYSATDNATEPDYDFVGRYFWARVTQSF